MDGSSQLSYLHGPLTSDKQIAADVIKAHHSQHTAVVGTVARQRAHQAAYAARLAHVEKLISLFLVVSVALCKYVLSSHELSTFKTIRILLGLMKEKTNLH